MKPQLSYLNPNSDPACQFRAIYVEKKWFVERVRVALGAAMSLASLLIRFI